MGKRTRLERTKEIVRLSRCVNIQVNEKEYNKGMKRGGQDARYNKFGSSCHKLTTSICLGYVHGWRRWSTSARFWHDMNRFRERINPHNDIS